MADSDTGTPPKAALIVATVLAVALAGVVAVVALTKGKAAEGDPNGPLALVSVPAPQAGGPDCAAMMGAVPTEIVSSGKKLTPRTLADPAPPATIAWGDTDPIVLRCGLERPPELVPTAQLRLVNGVNWLPVAGAGSTTWYAVDRAVYLALTVPDSAGTGPLQSVAEAIAAKLPAKAN
ncbi:DUF3515 domain-containing protein [Amycolatopsis samaneae]|uniref:DUF3515 domain-containing protein n=1 Tax=Amycolatopsis samaneae TaxID=664691 RepID=A0ABW5G939_9PSEU